MAVKFTPGERLIAVMLADVMEHLKVESELDPALIKRLIFGNDDWAMPLAYSGIFSDEAPADEEIEETYSILEMWRRIDNSVEALPDEEKARLDMDQFKFEGFDANNDAHYGVLTTLVSLGRYQERDPVLNSHSSVTIDIYRSMLRRFREVREAGMGRYLTLDQLKHVVGYRE